MSTKSTIFLTEDNEHCYEDCSLHQFNDNKNFIGDSIILEINKKNIEILLNDSEDLIIEFNNPNSEIYKIVKNFK